ncbi:MAG: phosphoethanolamine--lipid A transferase [Acinetobacter sp.]|nr:phosphoethanolamine--lipid A transferase [Acinetobacter sp.]
MKKFRLKLTSNQLLLLFIVYCVAVLNIGYWSNFASIVQETTGNLLLILTMPIFLIAIMNIIFQLFFYPYVHRVLFPLVLVLGAGASYAVMTQGIYFNDEQIQNIVQTDVHEAGAWINTKFILWIIFTGILPALFYAFCIELKITRPWYKEILWRVASVVISFIVIAAIAAVSYQNYASFFRNHKAIVHKIVPTNYLGASIKVAYEHYESTRPFVQIGLDAKRIAPQGEKKNVFIFVLGETTRAQNWGLNANAPATTPQLAAMKDVINFPNVSSCGTATAVSVPCMFSNMNRSDYDPLKARHQEGVLDILNRAGLYVSWKNNNGGCKGTCDRVKYVDIIPISPKEECEGGLCYDRNLLTGLKQEIEQMPNDGVIVLHTTGSHGPAYYQRYPKELRKFTPTCDSNQLQDCDPTALQNTYNNTVVAVDDTLARTIQLLKESNVNAAMWYISDHGESLGEKGMYLHGAPYIVAPSEQTHIPMVFWANDGFYQAKNLDAKCLAQNASKDYSHDNFFSSMIGIMDVATQEYHKEQDIFAQCRK